ncbi:ABC transporter substrate-binding protein [Haloechinothrix sp. LS1_15]|uniref:ABC transporter substrate-binding protein n=1 Tax=Haloechinothrix sp. LS1_15 TaxID=2652248 RepID=UPI0029451190|nr:ABC transporter substrate-binding protein [Haloechinothrix sp. LS1_15]MDV6013379.1 glycine/betaine ABC transporter substrate-binding protein [Haloechinothrix sp. LS1_15]
MVNRHSHGKRWLTGTGVAAVAALTLSACGAERVGDGDDIATDADCGEFNLAVSPWVGYEANAAVIAHVAEEELGCTVNKKELQEEVAWQGFGTGEVDAIVENWGHEDLKQRYIEEQGTAVEAGSTGVHGEIGWFVPEWLADEYPDITDWENLNDYADMFQTSESGNNGQFLAGDPSFVSNDEALVANLDLDFQVVHAGSETALNQAFLRAHQEREPLIGYFYRPHWLEAQIDVARVELPPYEEGCDDDPEAVACDYPEYDLDKIVRAEFAEEGGPAFQLVDNFQWSNEDQVQVASWITEDDMAPAEAGARWVEENPEAVDEWLDR